MLVVPTISPVLLSKAGEEDGFSKYEHVVVADMRKALRLTRYRPTWDESIIHETDGAGRAWRIFPTVEEVEWFLTRFMQACARHPTHAANGDLSLCIDVETTKDSPMLSQLICIGLGFKAPDEEQVINVPILNCGGSSYWTERDEQQIRLMLSAVFAHVGVHTLFHNKGFDKAVLWAQGLPVHGWSWCTMNAHHILDGEMPHNLGFVASLRTDGRYWKDDSKGDGGFLGIPDSVLRLYNLRDILSTMRIAPGLHVDLVRSKQWDLYVEQLQAVEVMTRGSIRGMLVDEERRSSPERDDKGKFIGLRPALEAQRDESIRVLRELTNNSAFEPAKPSHIQQLLFQRLGFPVVAVSEKTGAPKVDKESLMLLELLANTADQRTGLRAIIQFRQAEKFIGTFITGIGKFIHPATWRFHTQWKLLAVSGRFTSSPNAQNWNKMVKRMFRAAHGYKFVGVDLSQAELRYIAVLARDAALLQMYRDGINVHTVNACLLFKIQCPEPKDINAQTQAFIEAEMRRIYGLEYSSLPMLGIDQWKPIRTLAKNFVFGSNYGAEAETVYKLLRSKRDTESNKLLFPQLRLSEIQALRVMWIKRLHPEIPIWWDAVQLQIRKAGGYFCPISNRSRLFRGGFKRTEMLNIPIQMGVASWMNRCMVKIQQQFDNETGGAAQIIQQVHDALNSEVPDEYAKRAGEIKLSILNEQFQLNGLVTGLPADQADINDYLDKV